MRQLARLRASSWAALVGLRDIGRSVNSFYVLGVVGVIGPKALSGMGIRPLCFRNLLPASKARIVHIAYDPLPPTAPFAARGPSSAGSIGSGCDSIRGRPAR